MQTWVFPKLFLLEKENIKGSNIFYETVMIEMTCSHYY